MQLPRHNLIDVYELSQELENVKFIFNIPMLEFVRAKFFEIPERSGLVVSRARGDYPINQDEIVKLVTAGQRYSDAFFNERPDIDGNPTCVELIVVK